MPIPSRNGYRFDGWVDADGLEWSIMEYRAGDLTLEAQWIADEIPLVDLKNNDVCSLKKNDIQMLFYSKGDVAKRRKYREQLI